MCNKRGAKFLLVCVTLSGAYGVDWTNATLPTSITLNGGQRQDTITSTPSPQGWKMTTIGLNRNPHLSISGTAGSQYALTIKDSTTTFYSGGFSVASGIESTLISAHTLSIENGSVNISNGAKLSVISSGSTINAQGSEYGGESKVRFGSGSTLNLAQNATADFSNAKFFIHNGNTNLSQSANLKISANTIRLQNSLTNNGGSVNLTGNVYNVGYSGSIQSNSVSNFALNGGSVTITGNFYNGVESNNMSVDTTGGGLFNAFDPAFGGGGNLIITNGGTMSVTGILISQMGGDSIQGGGIYNPRNSTISIYGGTLQVGTLQNNNGSTLTFGIQNGTMGKLAGNLTNNGGNVVVDFSGANDGQTYQFITGTISGANITYTNADFANITLNGGSATYNLDSTKVNAFTQGLVGNERAIFEANKAVMGNAIYSSGSSEQIKQYMSSTNQSINDIINAPFSALFSLKNASADFMDSNTAGENLKVSVIGSKFLTGNHGNNVGTLIGAQVGSKIFNTTFSVSYGKANIEHTNSAQSITHASHNVMFRATQTIELSQSLHFLLGGAYLSSFGEINRHNTLVQSRTNASQDMSIIQIDSLLLKTFSMGERIAFTPYAGLHHYVYSIEALKENASNALQTQTNSFYALGVGIGIKGNYSFNGYNIFGKVHYELMTMEEDKNIKVLYGTQSLTYAPPLYNTLNIALGGSFTMANNTFIDVGGFFVNYGINNTIGLNASLRKEF